MATVFACCKQHISQISFNKADHAYFEPIGHGCPNLAQELYASLSKSPCSPQQSSPIQPRGKPVIFPR